MVYFSNWHKQRIITLHVPLENELSITYPKWINIMNKEPKYLLSKKIGVRKWKLSLNDEPSILKKYSYQILDSLHERPRGFNNLHYDLKISSTTLSKRLNELIDIELILINSNKKFILSERGLSIIQLLSIYVVKKSN